MTTSPNDRAIKILKDAEKANKYNLVYLCEPHNLPELHRLIVEQVTLSEHPLAGDIFHHKQSGKFCLHHQAKLKLSLAAAIEWDSVETRPVTIQRDYIHFQAVGQIRREYGRIIRFRGDCEFDLESLKDDLFDAYTAKAAQKNMNAKEREDWIRYCAMRDFRQKRANRLKLAATGAKSVVIDKLLNLKPGYPNKEQILMPFIIARCEIAPDLSDPAIRNQLSLLAVQAAAGVFGPKRELPAPASMDDGNVIDLDHETVSKDQDDFDFGDEPRVDNQEQDGKPPFDQLERKDQISEIHKLIKKSGYDPKRLQGREIGEMSELTLLKFHDHLVGMIQEAAK